MRNSPGTLSLSLAAAPWIIAALCYHAVPSLSSPTSQKAITMAKKTIEQVEVAGKKVLMRVDFNVPLDD